jgi:hypothetical protein
MAEEDFGQAHKCFVFTELKIKTPEIAAPQIAEAPAESVGAEGERVGTNHQDLEAPADEHRHDQLRAQRAKPRSLQGVLDDNPRSTNG